MLTLAGKFQDKYEHFHGLAIPGDVTLTTITEVSKQISLFSFPSLTSGSKL